MKLIFTIFILLNIIISGCANSALSKMGEKKMPQDPLNGNAEFKKMCEKKNWQWMLMKPTKDGKVIPNGEECWGCMVEGIEHVCNREVFINNSINKFKPSKS